MDTVVVLVTAVTNLVTVSLVVWMQFQLGGVAKNIMKIEKATNAAQDKLVASTAKASHAEGMADERSEHRARIAARESNK